MFELVEVQRSYGIIACIQFCLQKKTFYKLKRRKTFQNISSPLTILKSKIFKVKMKLRIECDFCCQSLTNFYYCLTGGGCAGVGLKNCSKNAV